MTNGNDLNHDVLHLISVMLDEDLNDRRTLLNMVSACRHFRAGLLHLTHRRIAQRDSLTALRADMRKAGSNITSSTREGGLPKAFENPDYNRHIREVTIEKHWVTAEEAKLLAAALARCPNLRALRMSFVRDADRTFDAFRDYCFPSVTTLSIEPSPHNLSDAFPRHTGVWGRRRS